VVRGKVRTAAKARAGAGARTARPARVRSPATAQLRALREKYVELWAKHRAVLGRAAEGVAARAAVQTLAQFVMRVGDLACATASPEQVIVRSARWTSLERDRTPWRAVARDAAAPSSAPTLLHLATAAARALLAASGPPFAAARYERPERGDFFDLRVERIPDQTLIGLCVRDVTRVVVAERDLQSARRLLETLRALAHDA
jgi:hypothetical protein